VQLSLTEPGDFRREVVLKQQAANKKAADGEEDFNSELPVR
jgi:hypothetical protein